jgi:hypothetical protein
MVIRLKITTQASLEKRERKGTKRWRPRTTLWEESHGENNDMEVQLML